MSWTPAGGFSTGKPYRPASTNLATNNAEAERADPDSMLAFYTAMLRLRNTHPSIARGRYVAPRVDGATMSFQRVAGDEHTVVVINYGEPPAPPASPACRRTPVCSACILPPGRRRARRAPTARRRARRAAVGAGVPRVAMTRARTPASNKARPAASGPFPGRQLDR